MFLLSPSLLKIATCDSIRELHVWLIISYTRKTINVLEVFRAQTPFRRSRTHRRPSTQASHSENPTFARIELLRFYFQWFKDLMDLGLKREFKSLCRLGLSKSRALLEFPPHLFLNCSPKTPKILQT